MAKLEEIIIENTCKAEGVVSNNDIMRQIRTQLSGKATFAGWVTSLPVVRIHEKNYIVRYRPAYTILRETRY